MESWNLVRLGDVCKIAKTKHDGQRLPYVGMEHIESGTGRLVVEPTPTVVKSATFRFDEDHVLYGRLRPYLNKVLVPDFEGHCSTELFPLECDSRLDRRFLFYWLTSETTVRRINRTSTGTRMPRANVEAVLDFSLPLPPLPEQEGIVAILDEAFAAIATATANGQRKLTSANALWTAVLDSGCSGVLTKRRRQESSVTEPAEGLSSRTTARRRAQSNTLGRPKEPVAVPETTIPDTWVWASPEQLSTHIVDCPHSTPKWVSEGLICIRTTNFRPGHLDLGSVKHVSNATYTERTKRLEPKLGDVIYSREGGILGIACVLPGGLKACLGQRMMLFRPDESVVHPRYFAYVLNSTHILAIVNRLTAGAAAPHINIRDIRRFPIPLPPLSEQQQIVAALDSMWTSNQRLEQTQLRKLTLLTELKQSILHKAFTGELTADFNAADVALPKSEA